MQRTSHRGASPRATARSLVVAGLLALLALALTSASAFAAAAAPAAKLELLAVHGPTNVPITEPVPEHTTIEVHGEQGLRPEEGRFEIEYTREDEKHGKTKPIKFDATAEQVQEALAATGAVGAGNVEVTGGPTPGATSWTYKISFIGEMAGINFEPEVEELEATHAEEVATGEEEPVEAEYEEAGYERGRRDEMSIVLVPVNTGSLPTTGTVTVTDTLPAGLTTSVLGINGRGWSCSPGEKEGKTALKCTDLEPVNAASESRNAIEIHTLVNVNTLKEGESIVNAPTVTWEAEGHKVTSEATDTIPISSAEAPFAVNHFHAEVYGVDGNTFTQAGGHPYSATTSFFMNTINHFNGATEEESIVSPGRLKDADAVLPEGFVGNPLLGNPAGSNRCTQAVFEFSSKGEPGESSHEGCPPEDQVGVANLYLKELNAQNLEEVVPVYNLVPPKGTPAEFGILFNGIPIRLDAHVRRLDGQYKVTVLSAAVNEAFNVDAFSLTLWGTPAEESHNAERYGRIHTKIGEPDEHPEVPIKPFLSSPTDCLQAAAEHESLENPGPRTIIHSDEWEKPGAEDAEHEPELSDGNWLTASVQNEPVTGCDQLKFEPEEATFTQSKPNPENPLRSGTSEAAAPSGYEFNLKLPQPETPETLVTPQLKDTVVTLPPGLSLSPSAGNGLESCSPAAIAFDSTAKGNCPASSQVGEVFITSALLKEELTGRVYVGEPSCNPCSAAAAENGELIHLYIEAEGKESEVRVKLPGNATINQTTGVVTSTFANNPQVPFTTLKLVLKGGPRASLANPTLCGTYTTAAVLTPWSVGGKVNGFEVLGNKPDETESKFNVDWNGEGEECPAGGLTFSPSLVAGTQNSQAGAYSEFDTVFSRADDREQQFSSESGKGIIVSTPVGLLGKLAGVTKCEAAEVAALIAETGTCPENARIATAVSAAGPGPEPFQATGPVFLTGPTPNPDNTEEILPFGLAIAVPAKTKAFNLGTVVVKAGIKINPQTSAITIISEPVPTQKDGIPLRVKQIAVKVDRPEFMFNPTNCEKRAIGATISGQAAGSEAPISVTREAPFQASNCGALPFAPKFTATTGGDFSKQNGTSFNVRVEAHPGEANIAKVELTLPVELPSRLETLQKACLAKTFEANPASCPPLSIVGSATAHTPLLNSPVTGPAYLVSHGAEKFPDVVFLLQGEGVKIELVGHTDIKHQVTYSRFETVPDAPINSFETVFPKGPDSILGAFGNLCEKQPKAQTVIIAQNNKRFEQLTPVKVVGCGPTVSISHVKLSGKALLVTVKATGGGTIKISGAGVKTTSAKGVASGTKTIRVPLSKSGLAAKAHKRKLTLKVSVASGGKSTTKSATVKV
jgi:hypothetical protein